MVGVDRVKELISRSRIVEAEEEVRCGIDDLLYRGRFERIGEVVRALDIDGVPQSVKDVLRRSRFGDSEKG